MSSSVPQTPMLGTIRRNRFNSSNNSNINKLASYGDKINFGADDHDDGIDGGVGGDSNLSIDHPQFIKSKYDGSWISHGSSGPSTTMSTTTTNSNNHSPFHHTPSPRHRPMTASQQSSLNLMGDQINLPKSLNPHLSSFGKSDKVLGCLGEVAAAVFSGIFGGYDYSYYDDYRRMLESNEEINIDDLKVMIEEQLERIDRGEIIDIDPEIQELVREAVQNLPEGVRKEYEPQDNDNHSDESESQFDDEPNVRRTFGYCSSALTSVASEIVGNKGGGQGGNQQFTNNIDGHNNTIVIVNN
ncbi:unnamed protein product [Diamesa tonsa]